MDPDEDTVSTSLRAYYDLLREYRGFTIVWIGEIIDNVGNWLNYVATLSLVEQLAGGRGLLISALLIVRFLPTFLLFPIAGVVADRIDRPKVLLVSCVVNVFIVLGLALIRRPEDIWAMYVLLFLQFTSSTFYDPARRALEPKLVPKKQLHLATTLDTFAWSVTVAVGSSLGGAVVSKLGTTMCFVLDSCTFLCAALCVLLLQVILKKDGYVNNDAEAAEEAEQLLAPLDSPTHRHTIPELAIASQLLAPNSIDAEMQSVSLHSPHHTAATTPSQHHSGAQTGGMDENSDPNQAAALHSHSSQHLELQPLDKKRTNLPDEQEDSEAGSRLLQRSESADSTEDRLAVSKGASSSTTGCFSVVQECFTEGMVSLKEAAVYISKRENRHVGVLCFIKFSGALAWGAADILQVKYSEMPSMQTLGDGPQTLGFVFAAVGVGCFFGPIFFNYFTPPRKPQLLRSTAASFYCFVVGYLLLVFAADIKLLLVSTVVRSAGSAVLWIYSTLMLQYIVPNQLLGRVMALEMALFTVADSASAVFGGAAFDLLHLNARQVSSIMLGVTLAPTTVWTGYAWWQSKLVSQEAQKGGAETGADAAAM